MCCEADKCHFLKEKTVSSKQKCCCLSFIQCKLGRIWSQCHNFLVGKSQPHHFWIVRKKTQYVSQLTKIPTNADLGSLSFHKWEVKCNLPTFDSAWWSTVITWLISQQQPHELSLLLYRWILQQAEQSCPSACNPIPVFQPLLPFFPADNQLSILLPSPDNTPEVCHMRTQHHNQPYIHVWWCSRFNVSNCNFNVIIIAVTITVIFIIFTTWKGLAIIKVHEYITLRLINT